MADGASRCTLLDTTTAGQMVVDVWRNLSKLFPGIDVDAMVLMPDHLHGVIMLGCDPAISVSVSLGEVIQNLKGCSITKYLAGVRGRVWGRVPGRLWQLRYSDRIIRNDRELEAIREFIEGNPAR